MKTNLYTVNAAIVLPVRSKTRLRRILTLLAFSVLAVALADGGTIYEATNSTDLQSHDFGTLNPSTGVFTSINSGGSALVGLGSTGNGTLYGMTLFGSTLYQINPVTGVQTPVGNASISAILFGATTTGFFALDDLVNLYSINRTNGSSTLIGPTGVTGEILGFSSNASVLYLSSDTGLYSLNTTTGAAHFIGDTGETIGAMVLSSGQLYAGVETLDTQLRLDTLNPMTGAPTAGPNLTGTTQLMWGLATTAVPDSGGTLLLLSAALAPLLMLRRANSGRSLPRVSPGE
jgi:hypothetical protein